MGGAPVSECKRIMISMPSGLLDEVDIFASMENMNRSELIREAMKLYIAEKNKKALREQMKRGYQEMAALNLALSEEGMASEEEVDQFFQRQLAECR